MGCCSSKKPNVPATRPSVDNNTRPSVVMDPRTKSSGGPHDPWEQPKPLPSPYPKGNVDVNQLLREEEDSFANQDIPVQREIVVEQIRGKLVPESELKKKGML